MKPIYLFLIAIALSGFAIMLPSQSAPTYDCAKQGHAYGSWYKQAAMFYIPEQPAHVCKYCGAFQNEGGKLQGMIHAGMTEDEAWTSIVPEIEKDIPNYEKAPAENRR